MADDRVRLPSGGGGIMQYYDEYKSSFSFPMKQVLLWTAIFIVLIIILHAVDPLGLNLI